MNNDNNGFSRFQFSTELDRGEKKVEPVSDVENKPSQNNNSNKHKNNKKNNYKNNRNNRRNSRRRNNKKKEDSVELVKENMEEKSETIETVEELIPVEEKSTEEVSIAGDVGKAFEPDNIETEENSFEVPDFQIEPENIPTIEEEKENIEMPSEEEVEVQEAAEEIKNEEVVEEKEDEIPIEPVQKVDETIVGPAVEVAEEVVQENNPYEEELSSIKEKGVNITEEARDIDLDHTLYRDQYFVQNGESEDAVVEEVKAAIDNQKSEENADSQEITHTIKKVYLSFQARVILLILGIIVLFGTACFIIYSTLQSNVAKKVNFLEKSTIHYEVCQMTNDPYNALCEPEGKSYVANNTASVHIDYHYEALFEELADYNLSYHVVVVNKIFDRYDPKKVLYEDEDLIKEKTSVQGGQNPAVADVSVEIDYQKYYSFVSDYKSKYSSNADSKLYVILYIDDGNNTRNIGEVVIPLADDNFEISRNNIDDSKQEYILEERDWTNANTFYIVIGSVLVLLSLFLLFHLTKLALAITGKKSKYQELLMSILNEYDRLIVIARDGYESADEKEIVKVYTFDELLDKRSLLNKPIIYSRINNVKSEFIVEDETCIYKYILKEADMGEQN